MQGILEDDLRDNKSSIIRGEMGIEVIDVGWVNDDSEWINHLQ